MKTHRAGVWATAGVAVLALWAAACGAAEPGPGLVGKPAPEIQAAYWLNTEALSLQGLRGKIAVVEFWATWCPPCRASIPHLIEMNHKIAGKGVVFIGLTDEDRKTVEPFAREMKMDYAVGGGSKTSGAYGVTGIPHAFIVAPSGTVAWEGHPMAGLDRALESQLEKTPPSTMAPRDPTAAILDRVGEEIQKQNYLTAAEWLAKVVGADTNANIKRRVEGYRAALAKAAAKSLADAEQRVREGAWYEASVALEEVLRLVPGSEEARRAEAKRTEWMGDEKIRPVIEQGRRERRAAEMLAAAEKDCKSWLSMARNYVNAGMPDKAGPYLKDILAKYPDTPFAEEARKVLAEIGK